MAHPGGRPTDYNEEIASIICDLVSVSTKGLERICAENPELPAEVTIHRWRLRHPKFGQDYAKAKQNQAELLAQEIIEIADESSGDIKYDKDGNESLNGEYVARSRLRVDARKWVASKLLPKVYGDKQVVEQINATNDSLKLELEQLRKELNKNNESTY